MFVDLVCLVPEPLQLWPHLASGDKGNKGLAVRAALGPQPGDRDPETTVSLTAG